jgi:hypothetical protein
LPARSLPGPARREQRHARPLVAPSERARPWRRNPTTKNRGLAISMRVAGDDPGRGAGAAPRWRRSRRRTPAAPGASQAAARDAIAMSAPSRSAGASCFSPQTWPIDLPRKMSGDRPGAGGKAGRSVQQTDGRRTRPNKEGPMANAGRVFAIAADWGINELSSKGTWRAARGAQGRAAGCSGVA